MTINPKLDIAKWQHNYRLQIDNQLIQKWREHQLDRVDHLSLIALGGYGRAELYPYSDIDLSIVHLHPLSAKLASAVGAFVRSLWDDKLKIGSNTLSFDEARELARTDLNFMTALLEARLLQGSNWNFIGIQNFIRSAECFGGGAFLHAKIEERDQRWSKFQASTHSLEPNLKNSPGGLRDIHTLEWIARKYLHASSLEALVHQGSLGAAEHRKLKQCWRVLAWLRMGVQSIAQRSDDRLLFERQQILAAQRQQSQQELMQLYYRTAESVRALALLLLEDWQSTLTDQRPQHKIKKLQHENLVLRDGRVDFTHSEALGHDPNLMLQAFVAHSQHALSTSAIRAIYNNRFLLDRSFRAQPQNQQAFLTIMAAPIEQLAPSLALMQRCALLSRYLPAFKRIAGNLQYDLFHQYSVDAHTLLLFHKLAEVQRQDDDAAALAYQAISDKLPLHLAMLFHDLGKGQGGDHSKVGAGIVRRFCRKHQLSAERSELITWLVEQHLTLSDYAQKSDPEDIANIQRFVDASGADREKLKNLLVLTVVDIQATNDQLWNNWRRYLIYRFYRCAEEHLLAGGKAVNAQQQLRRKRQQLAKHLAEQHDNTAEHWRLMPEAYKLEQSIESLAFALQCLQQGKELQLRPLPASAQHYELFVHSREQAHSFARLAATLHANQLDIIKASLHSDSRGMVWDSLVVHSGYPRTTAELRRIAAQLAAALACPELAAPKLGTRARISAAFKTNCRFIQLERQTVLDLITADRSGLLAWLAHQLSLDAINIEKALCNTLAHRVEDQLYLSQNSSALDPSSIEKLERTLTSKLDKA